MKKLLICNQKMFLTHDEALNLKKHIDNINMSNVNLIICPSFLNFDVFNNYEICAQDCFYEDKGAYTGEISSYDLNLRGIKYSLVGHSERRKLDDDKIINLKIKALFRNSMTPILCIGETLTEKSLRKTSEVLKKQLTISLKNINIEDDQEIIIAYEPRWIIGTGKCLSKIEIEDSVIYIRKILDELNIGKYRLLYGGSIDSSNVSKVLTNLVDGYLLGNACVNENELKKIIECIK